MPGELEIIAIMKPKPGKADRVSDVVNCFSSLRQAVYEIRLARNSSHRREKS